jgi:VanZ family protein
MVMDRNTLFAWLATLVVLVLCLFPKSGMQGVETSRIRIPHADKVVHFGMFAMFGLLWTRAGRARAPVAIRVFAAVVALAVGTELAQGLHFISRDPDVLDALADAVGGAFGIGVALLWAARSSAREALEPTV